MDGRNLQDLVGLHRDAALALFATLPAPEADVMRGEFAGHVPDYSAAIWHAFVAETGMGRWLGKAYAGEAHGDWPGQGYNLYQTKIGTDRRLRFGWAMGPSRLDGRPALLMDYTAFDNWAGQNRLMDEVRLVRPGLFLGVYYTEKPVPGFTPRPGEGRSGPEVFILSGPAGPWVGPRKD